MREKIQLRKYTSAIPAHLPSMTKLIVVADDADNADGLLTLFHKESEDPERRFARQV